MIKIKCVVCKKNIKPTTLYYTRKTCGMACRAIYLHEKNKDWWIKKRKVINNSKNLQCKIA